jgi:hypothetical protein
VPASAYVIRLSGGFQEHGDPVEELYVVAVNAPQLEAAFRADPSLRLPELLARGVWNEYGSEQVPPGPAYRLDLWTVQRGELEGPIDLVPYVTMHVHDQTVRLNELQSFEAKRWALVDARFTVALPALPPLSSPVLSEGQLLSVTVPDELCDMTDLGLGETEVNL